MTIWYKNYFGNETQPWARQVEKEVSNLKSAFDTAEVNNLKRDNQLASSLRQIQAASNAASDAAAQAGDAAAQAQTAADNAFAAATTANTSLNGLVSLGTDGSSYSVHGGNITANTITANEISASYVYAGNLSANQINSGSLSADFITGGTIDASNISGVSITGASISGGSITSTGANGTVTVTNGSVAFVGGGKTGSINPTSTYGLGLTSSDRVYISAPNGIEGAFATFAEYDGLNINAQGTLRRSALNGGGTTGASITDGGFFVRTSSSQRYKQDIELLEINLVDIWNLAPKTFRRIDEVEQNGESARIYPGLIAEDLAGTSLDKFVFYSQDEDGNPRPEGIHYPELTAALLLAVQNLNTRVQELEDKVK